MNISIATFAVKKRACKKNTSACFPQVATSEDVLAEERRELRARGGEVPVERRLPLRALALEVLEGARELRVALAREGLLLRHELLDARELRRLLPDLGSIVAVVFVYLYNLCQH